MTKFRRLHGEGQPPRGLTLDTAYMDIVEEIADVAIMLEQMRVLHGIPIEQIRGVVDHKLSRTMKLIRGSDEG